LGSLELELEPESEVFFVSVGFESPSLALLSPADSARSADAAFLPRP